MAMSSFLLALAVNPTIQEKLYAEIVSVVGCEDRDIRVEELKFMTYLDQVMKETLRIFPIVPMITRITSRDLKLSYGTIPAGATAAVMIHGVQTDPRHYPQPDKFNPDRFLPENIAKRHKNAFLPFATGPRNCIGKAYLTSSLKIALIHVIKKFKFKSSADINKLTYLPGLVYKSQSGYNVEIFLRH